MPGRVIEACVLPHTAAPRYKMTLHHKDISRHGYYIIITDVFSFAGDLSAEDPVHGLVHRPHAEPRSQPPAVVLSIHALWGRHPGPVEASGGHKGSGGCGTS